MIAEDHVRAGKELCWQLRPQEAIPQFRRAIELAPDLIEAHLALSEALLWSADVIAGHREWEWRHKVPGHEIPPLPRPRWDGSDIRDRNLLLFHEEGYGDVLQYAGYVPYLARELGIRVMLTTPPELTDLLATLPGLSRLLPPGSSIDETQVYLPLCSLPAVLPHSIDRIPRTIPYLFADARRAAAWKSHLARIVPNAFNVGVAWSGNPNQRQNALRSIPLEQLAPLAAVPGIALHWVQNDAWGRDAIARARVRVHDHSAHLRSFADTAGLIAALDLVITIDTSVAHLAGAMGKATWLLLPHLPAGRWMLGRRDTPWYPSMTLFRQPSPGDWSSVVAEVREFLPR
jgi:hypothetical protein